MTQQSFPPVCDYEGSNYRTDFWENQGRDYEDGAERIALRRLLPAGGGRRILEIGAGFGRLTNELSQYEHVVLLDYSRSLLADARARLGDAGYTYVAADIYRMPFAPGTFDAATMIRVIHHIADISVALDNIHHILAPDSTFILEYANKRNMKALIRYALGRQEWDPNGLEPAEFVELNFDFHPTYMQLAMREAGFTVQERVPVSYFRVGVIKRLPMGLLMGMERLAQRAAPLFAPSIFTLNHPTSTGPDQVAEPLRFHCPTCGGDLADEGDILRCASDQCGLGWAVRDGIYDFKEPVNA
jgi:SAM-dependent methyltransferase